MLSEMMNRPCTILRQTESGDADRYGNPEDDVTEIESYCELQQRSRREPDDTGELSDTVWDAFFHAGTQLGTADRVVDRLTGHVFELVGDPWSVRDPDTRVESHVEATLRRTAGEEDVS